jgi:hypothetical protein
LPPPARDWQPITTTDQPQANLILQRTKQKVSAPRGLEVAFIFFAAAKHN